MANVTIDKVFRSLGTAAILVLNDKDPEADFSQLDNLPKVDGRASVSFANQSHPMTYGSLGTFLVPGVVVEFGEIENNRGKCKSAVILSIARIISSQVEVEIANTYQLSKKLEDLIYKRQSCPIYNFESADDVVTEKLGRVLWHYEVFRDPKPRERLVQNPQFGGWMRNEIRFTTHFTIDSGPL